MDEMDRIMLRAMAWERAKGEIDRLSAEGALMRRALEWYASGNNDRGSLAKSTLKTVSTPRQEQ